MREILFRGRTISTGEWVEGGIMKTFHPNYDHKSEDDFYNRTPNCYCICANGKDYFVEQKTIGQYTGLTDKNGTKIFEGDILQGSYSKRSRSVVISEEWNCGCCSDVYGFSTSYIHGYSQVELGEYEDSTVIGNIHDNPELVRGEEE